MKPMNRLPSELEGEVTIRVVDDMPIASPGFVIYDETGHCNVYLNGRYNHESNMQTADHELRHILNDDFFNSDPIEVIESRADGHATPRRMPKLFKASGLLKSNTKNLPPVGKVGRPKIGSDEVSSSPVPPYPISRSAPKLSPHQTAVLLRAISDLDDWLFRDTTYDL